MHRARALAASNQVHSVGRRIYLWILDFGTKYMRLFAQINFAPNIRESQMGQGGWVMGVCVCRGRRAFLLQQYSWN